MTTTYSAISLGQLADMDTIEGNNVAENADALVGQTFGGADDELLNHFVTVSAVGDVGAYYDQDNDPDDQFSIDGGAPQTFDGTAVYNATLTYSDGTTAQITAVLAQDVDGNTYLFPEFSDNADQQALEAGPIQSITLDSLYSNTYDGTYSSRQDWDYVTCFTRSTPIETPDGARMVEDLQPGDLVSTVDHGAQVVRWVGRRTVRGEGALAPVRIGPGALGNARALRVSPQHRILLGGWRAELFCGAPEVLVPAIALVNGDTITRLPGGEVTYYHLLFDRHELVRSAGIISESFHPAACGWGALEMAARDEILDLFPHLRAAGLDAYGATARPVVRSRAARLLFG